MLYTTFTRTHLCHSLLYRLHEGAKANISSRLFIFVQLDISQETPAAVTSSHCPQLVPLVLQRQGSRAGGCSGERTVRKAECDP